MLRNFRRLTLSAVSLGLCLLPVQSEEDHDHAHEHGELAGGHADVEVAFEDGELHLHLHDKTTGMELEPGEVVLSVSEEAESSVPEGANFAFLGNVGDPLWILPQNAQADVLFLGIGGEIATGVLTDDTAYVELVSVEGPGNFFAYNTDTFGVPNVMINSADGLTSGDRLAVSAGGHFHVDWTFDAEGDYGVTFVVKATLPDGTAIESEPTTLSFEVGHHDDEGQGHDDGELAGGHADVEVAFEDGELHLHLHDHATEMELEPGETVLSVSEAAETTVPEGEAFAFLGHAGDPLWILPQNAQADVLFLGIGGEIEAGALMDDTAYVELVSVEGPGNFFVYAADGFGVPNVMINSADGITSEDRIPVLAGSHSHVDWTFDAEGDYGVTFVVKATLPDGTAIESEPTTLAFEVGHHGDEGQGHGGGDDDAVALAIVQDDHGHVELRFATHDGIVYQMETSTDLQTWQDEGEAFIGNGEEKMLELPSGPHNLYTRLKVVSQN